MEISEPKRGARVVELRKKGLSYREIGLIVGLGMMQVKNIGVIFAPELFTNQQAVAKFIKLQCPYCEKSFKKNLKDYHWAMRNKPQENFFCSIRCNAEFHRIYKDIKTRNRAHDQKRKLEYGRNPRLREIQKRSSARWRENLKKDLVRLKRHQEKQRKYGRNRYKRKRLLK